ncbi:MAG: DUF3667 domain-containing protein [Lutibacter sp.]|nr:DUF3667 domain-containing protein [Lutibacter sp.]MDT8417364.1 DUF3667 domain-containing protein [Lutibacter sp.]
MKFQLQRFRHKQSKGLECLNCGQPLLNNENFCSYCGQKNTASKLSIGNYVNKLVSGFLSYDSQFWTTFIPLLIKPGKVAKEYILGKRVKYVNPFQLYLQVSIIFFLILGISNKIEGDKNPIKDIATTTKTLDSLAKLNPQKRDSLKTEIKRITAETMPKDSANTKVISDLENAFKLYENDADSLKKPREYAIKTKQESNIGFFDKIADFVNFRRKFPSYSNEQAMDSLGYQKTFWNTFYYQQVKKAEANIAQLNTEAGVKNLIKKFISYISISMFVFLPVFTLFLKLLYIRKKFTYMEHLVFVFNTQTVFFLLFIIFYLLNLVFKMENAFWIFVLLFLVYFYKSLRNFYRQKRFITIVKFILLNSYYTFLAIVGVVIVAVISFISG